MINWYPGHMTKSIRMIEDNLRIIDVVIYVLDARAPNSCINPDFNRLVGDKPIIYALNKAELGSRSEVEAWLNYLSTEKTLAVAITGTSQNSVAPLVKMTQKLCGDKLDRYKAKGINRTLKAMVLGVPNTGKSTIINSLCGKTKTVTGNKAGVTRAKQWVKVGETLEVLDTPGTLYPKLSDQTIARRLGFLGSINDDILDFSALALDLIRELEGIDSQILVRRYNVSVDGDERTILDRIALSRSLILRGGLPDSERAASAVIDDFRKGRMGAITLDRISEMTAPKIKRNVVKK